jgi:glycosyltransferase involved in cell wall biosynthesis
MNFNPNITIAIPVYERFEFFVEALKSATEQTVRCNVIVVDNCSSHNRFKEYIDNLGYDFVRYYRNDKNLGALGNWNSCIKFAATPWVSVLHSDDMLSLYYIEEVTKYMSDEPGQICFMCGYETGEQPHIILQKPKFSFIKRLKIKPSYFAFGNVTAFPGVVFNKNKLNQASFNEKLDTVSDYDFWYHTAQVKPISLINAKLAYYRVSAGQDSAVSFKKVIEQSYNYKTENLLKKSGLLRYFSLYEIYYTYKFYLKKFNIVDTGQYNFTNPLINTSFNAFDKFAFIHLMPYLFKGYRKLYLYISGIL